MAPVQTVDKGEDPLFGPKQLCQVQGENHEGCGIRDFRLKDVISEGSTNSTGIGKVFYIA